MEVEPAKITAGTNARKTSHRCHLWRFSKEVGPKGGKSAGIRNKTSSDVVQSGRRRAVEPGKLPTNQAGVIQKKDLPTGKGRGEAGRNRKPFLPRPKVNSTVPGESGASAGLSLPPASEQESL